jgi:hypothetical protein
MGGPPITAENNAKRDLRTYSRQRVAGRVSEQGEPEDTLKPWGFVLKEKPARGEPWRALSWGNPTMNLFRPNMRCAGVSVVAAYSTFFACG